MKLFVVIVLAIATGISTAMSDEKAVFGGGCFWCVEAAYQGRPGIKSVISGYAGGKDSNPTYEKVSMGNTGHAEVVEITFDPSIISYESLLDLFWDAHDPTTLNRQGADVGTQYRSIIVAKDAKQREAAEKSKATAQPRFRNPITTEIIEGAAFYPAEAYHQDFYKQNPNHPYSRAVIAPKMEKLKPAPAKDH